MKKAGKEIVISAAVAGLLMGGTAMASSNQIFKAKELKVGYQLAHEDGEKKCKSKDCKGHDKKAVDGEKKCKAKDGEKKCTKKECKSKDCKGHDKKEAEEKKCSADKKCGEGSCGSKEKH